MKLTAQTSKLGIPYTLKGKMELTTDFYVTPFIDNQTEIQQEKTREKSARTKEYYFGKEFKTDIDIFKNAQKTILPDGNLLYQFGIKCKQAVSINVQFDTFELAKGAVLYLVDPLKKKFDGAYTHLNNNPAKMLGTELLYSDKVIIEVCVPKEQEGKSKLHLSMIVHGFRSLNEMAKALNSSGSCEIDVNCPLGLGWENQRNSVAMVMNGGGFCTGSLVNNTSGTIIPYFLSANHCGVTPGLWVYRFRWESPEDQADCATSAPSVDGPTDMNINGGTLCANYAGSDFTLTLLNQAPNPAWGIYYNGWDRSDIPATQLTCIHHPEGDIKKITRDNSTAISTSFNGGEENSHWRAPSWNNGVTEGGSSGSPLFDQHHRTIGQLHGGNSTCGGQPETLNDEFGKFHTSWTGGGTNDTRLSNWLDPGGLNPLFIDGVDPAIPNLTVDGGIGNVTFEKKELCSGPLTPTISIFNSGKDTLFSVSIYYGYDGKTDSVFIWNDTLVTFENTTIVLPPTTLTNGNHSLTAIFKNNLATDQNSKNDTLVKSFSSLVDGEMLKLELTIYCFADENKWQVLNTSQVVVASGGDYSFESPTPIVDSFCLTPDCYTFKLFDSGGDGIAALNSNCGDGFYQLTNSQGSILSQLKPENAGFGSVYSTYFCAGIHEVNSNEYLRIFPNPATNSVVISIQDSNITKLEIFSITGQLIHSDNQLNKSAVIDISSFSQGMYLVRVESNYGTAVKPLVVE